MLTTGPRGTRDILPATVGHWRYVEDKIRQLCRRYSYQEIRTPIFEHTELFLRSIGETTDIVDKEMYTFFDRGGRSITLRPENTAAVVRAFLEHKLYAQPQPIKVYYIGPMFRYDRPQAGRFRQFHQFGVEVLGAQHPMVDAEIIMLALHFFQELGLHDYVLHINSVGCPVCRPRYREALQSFLRDKISGMCEDCQNRFEKNPLRILDCKRETCRRLSQGAPEVLDCLCDDCRSHFAAVQRYLTAVGVSYQIDSRLVRGLDYYTKTAFEIQYAPLGAQSAICGGGRYDGLVQEMGGEPTPGIGFAIGLERLLLALEKQELLPPSGRRLDIYFAPLDAAAQEMAFKWLYTVRRAGFAADIDLMNRSLKGQLKYAAKYPANFAGIIGEEEQQRGQVTLRNLTTGEQEMVDQPTLLARLAEKQGD